MNEKPHTATSYVEVELAVPRPLSDVVCDFIIENFCSGLILEEEEDSQFVVVKFYMPQEYRKDYRQLLRDRLSELVSDAMPAVPEIIVRTIRDTEWEELYRVSVKPVRVTDEILVRPPWHDDEDDAPYQIIIEPRMAFGTGKHETTKSCLQIINEQFKQGMRFLDLGCGSGILSILASQMGAGYIKAVDYDIAAIENCRENFLANKVTTPHDIVHGSIEKCQGDPPYDFVCANIIKKTILRILKNLDMLTARDGVIVLSGLLLRDEAEVTEQLRLQRLDKFSIHRENEWLTYTVIKD